MSWTKAVFFGGALLVLAACGDATAPTSPSALRRVDNSAALTAGLPVSGISSTTSIKPVLTTNPIICSGIVIHVGADGSIITTGCEPSPNQ